MKFLCLICAETVMEQMSEAEAKKHYQGYADLTMAMRDSGQLIDCNRLLPPSTAVTVRVRHGRVSTTDGPWIETKEQLGGYYVIEAEDINAAIELAAKIPGAQVGCVEVRPIAEDAPTLRAIGSAAA